jgi:O-antigen ligase
MYNNTLKPMAKKAFWPLLIILVFFAASPLINMGLNIVRFHRFEENFIERARSITDLNEESNLGRLQMWKESLTYGFDHPMGVGLGNFIFSLNNEQDKGYDDIADDHNKRFNLPQKYITAHSLYLQLFVELGVAGLLVFAWFWWEYFKRIWIFIRPRSTENNILLFFVMNTSLAFIWIMASAVFDVTLFNDKVLMYFFISLGITGVIVTNYKKLNEEK